MIKQTIKDFFQKPQTNKITDVPPLRFSIKRHPFDYLIPEKYIFKDLRKEMIDNDKIKAKHQQNAIKRTQSSNKQKMKFTDQLLMQARRYYNQFKFRHSALQRFLRHTLQYSIFSGLMIFGFYSQHLKSWSRTKYVLKHFSKHLLYSSIFFSTNQLLFPIFYKLRLQSNQKPMFSFGNLLSMLFVFPIILLIERKLFMSLRKIFVICAFGMFRDMQTELQRFYKLNPYHYSTLAKQESQRFRHPCEDPRKRLVVGGNSRAQRERNLQEQQKITQTILSSNKGQKIPSSHLYLILPEVYRKPTQEQKIQHQRKAIKITQQIIDQRGIKWLSVSQKDIDKQNNKTSIQKQKEKKNSQNNNKDKK